jgi:uncharacterized protein (TIGR03437 family)
MERKRKIYFAKVAVVMSAVPLLLWAHSAGPDAGKAGVPGESTCNQAQCHVGTALNGGSGSVKVTFPGGSTYSAGIKQHLVVTVSDSNANGKAWGFQLTARPSSDPKTQAGSFTSTDRLTAVVCNVPPFDEFQNVFLDFGQNQNCPANKSLAYIEHTLAGSSRSQSGSQTFEFDWTPPANATGNITLYVAGNAANGDTQPTGDHIYTATYTLTPAAAGSGPTIDAGGVVSGASFLPGIVPGSWLTIKGSNLSPVPQDTWDKAIVNGVLPTSLDGVSVSVGSKPAYVYFISPGQINVQAPDVGTGPVPVTVTTPNGTSTAVTATVVAQAPAFFLWPGSQAVATRNSDASLAVKNGTFAGATTVAAKPGDVLILWGTGFGPTTPAVAAGIQVPSDTIHNASAVTVKIGSADAQVFGAALAPGFAGLYQVAIQVPASMADGDYALKATVSGVTSPDGVILSVKK